MTFFLTLVAKKELNETHLDTVCGILNRSFSPAEFNWLHEGKAAEIQLPECIDDKIFENIISAIDKDRIDALLTPTKSRRKKLLIADMDSTIVTSETLDDIAAELGIGDIVSKITARAMRGELDFKAALTERVALLAGKSTDVLETISNKTKLTDGALSLVKTMRKNGAICVLISGGFTYFTEHVADLCGFDHHHGNILSTHNNRITGRVEEPVLDKSAKFSFMQEYVLDHKLNMSDVLAIGDGANDYDIISNAGLGIGFHPKDTLKKASRNHIRHGDLTAALYAQGYTETEIIRK